MRAVNLIPPDASRSDRARLALVDGMGAYAVLGLLALLVVLAGTWALSDRQLSSKRAELSRVQGDSQATLATAAALAPYTQFAALHQARVETVGGLLDGRFDWSRSMADIGRVVPQDVALTSFVATATPTSQVEGAGGGATGRSARPGPAVELLGCARSHDRVSKLLVSLRAIDGVEHVSLASSEKSESTSANESECRSTDQMPQFKLTVFYAQPGGISAAADATAPTAPTAPTGPAAPAPATAAPGVTG
jgi:Tfp pilus assembly protein PilN